MYAIHSDVLTNYASGLLTWIWQIILGKSREYFQKYKKMDFMNLKTKIIFKILFKNSFPENFWTILPKVERTTEIHRKDCLSVLL